MVSLAHKIELKPNNKQRTYFRKACGVSRFAWNWALSNWESAYEKNKVLEKKDRTPINGLALKKEFNAVKKSEFPWVYEVTKYASQQPFIQINHAFQRFFKGITGRPKFKRKSRSTDSFYVGGDQIKVQGKKIWVPNLGWVRLKEHLRFEAKETKIRSATFSKKADRWFVSVQVDTEINKKAPPLENVGVDLGINTLAQLSDGTAISSPKPLKKSLRALRRASRRLSKKTKGSSKFKRQKLKIQKIHSKISNIRKETLHQITSYLTNTFRSLAIEDLNVRGILKNHRLARAVSDLGFYEFRRQLEYKSKMYGNTLLIADRFFASSKICSKCGSKKKELSLKDRSYSCECGLSICRDLNASINLKNLISLGRAAPEVTPREMTALDLWRLSKNPTSIGEVGNKHQICYAQV